MIMQGLFSRRVMCIQAGQLFKWITTLAILHVFHKVAYQFSRLPGKIFSLEDHRPCKWTAWTLMCKGFVECPYAICSSTILITPKLGRSNVNHVFHITI